LQDSVSVLVTEKGRKFIEHQINLQFCVKLGKTYTEWYNMLKAVCSNEVMQRIQISASQTCSSHKKTKDRDRTMWMIINNLENQNILLLRKNCKHKRIRNVRRIGVIVMAGHLHMPRKWYDIS